MAGQKISIWAFIIIIKYLSLTGVLPLRLFRDGPSLHLDLAVAEHEPVQDADLHGGRRHLLQLQLSLALPGRLPVLCAHRRRAGVASAAGVLAHPLQRPLRTLDRAGSWWRRESGGVDGRGGGR